ncbi:MAG: response regulator [Desulfobacteraceae bacterium]
MTHTPRKILILDDEESIRQSIAAFLEDEGLVVFEAGSAEEGLSILKENDIFGAVVDIRLPGKDGNRFMTEAQAIIPGIRLIVNTGSADYIPPEDVKKLGISSKEIFIKPADLNQLKNVLMDRE